MSAIIANQKTVKGEMLQEYESEASVLDVNDRVTIHAILKISLEYPNVYPILKFDLGSVGLGECVDVDLIH